MAKRRKNNPAPVSDTQDPSPPQTDPTTPDVVEDVAPAEAEDQPDPAASPPLGILGSVGRLFGGGKSD